MGLFDRIKGFFKEKEVEKIDFSHGVSGYKIDAKGNEFLIVPTTLSFDVERRNGKVTFVNTTDKYKCYKVVDGLHFQDNVIRSGYHDNALGLDKGVKELHVTTYITDIASDSLQDNLYQDESVIKIDNWKKDVSQVVQSIYNINDESIENLPLKKKETNYSVKAFKEDLGIDLSDINICQDIQALVGYEDKKYHKMIWEEHTNYPIHCYPGIHDHDLEISDLKDISFNPKDQYVKFFIEDAKLSDMNIDDIKRRVWQHNLPEECYESSDCLEQHFYATNKFTNKVNGIIDKKLGNIESLMSQPLGIGESASLEQVYDANEKRWNKCREDFRDAIAIAKVAIAVNQDYLNRYGVETLKENFMENLESKLDTRHDEKYIGSPKIGLLDKKAKEIEEQLMDRFVSNNAIKEEFLKWHRGEKEDFPKKFKLETPEQQKLITEYNTIVKNINEIYDQHMMIEKEKAKKEEKRLSVIRNNARQNFANRYRKEEHEISQEM